jgi:hypothetical protein
LDSFCYEGRAVEEGGANRYLKKLKIDGGTGLSARGAGESGVLTIEIRVLIEKGPIY